MKAFLCSILLVLALESSAQFNSRYYYRDVWQNEQHFDSLIRLHAGDGLPETYFVITYPLAGATTSWAPQFIKAYSRARQYGTEVVLLFHTNGGPRIKDVPLFMRDLLRIPVEDIASTRCIFNDSLYDIITGGRNLVRLQYYFRKRLYYNEGEKWHDVGKGALPEEHVRIRQTEKIRLTGIDSLILFERDPMIPFKKDHLIIVGDARNRLFDVNTKTGQVQPLLDLSRLFQASDLYCRYISSDSAKCRYAKAHEAQFAAMNRKLVMTDGARVAGAKLILSLLIEVPEKEEKDYRFRNDEGNETLLKAGNQVLNTYSFVLVYDLQTQTTRLFPYNEIPEAGGRSPYVMMGNGFHMWGDTIVTSVNSWIEGQTNTIGLVKLVPQNNRYVPVENIAPRNQPSALLEDYFSKSFFYPFCDTVYYSFNVSPHIFLPGRDSAQSRFYGNGEAPFNKEIFARYMDDTITPQINFLIHEIKPVLDGTYLLACLKYKGKPLFEVKNRMLKTVDIIDAAGIPGLQRYTGGKFRDDLLIHDDRIFIKTVEDGEMYINIFSVAQSK